MIKVGDKVIEKGSFPDGTILLKYLPQKEDQMIYWQFESNEELITLYYLTRHLQQAGIQDIELVMPYIPNARQDRVKKSEDVFTLKYFCEMINSLSFKRVFVLDPHSDVSVALLDRVSQLSIKPYVKVVVDELQLDPKKDIIFYPDNGSQKRYSSLLEFPNAFGIKQRDWETGEIKGLEVSGHIPEPGFTVLIIDDISSYGGTFYFSALKLKALGAGKIYLYITHCENSILQGKLMSGDLIEHIYTTNSLITCEHEKITVLPIKTGKLE